LNIFRQSTDRKLNHALVMLGAILMGEVKIMSELDDLTTQVTNTKAGIDSAVVLLDGLAAKLDAAIASGNPAALVALSAELKDKTDALAAAVVADTR
jgi:hypothetical protein